MHPRSRGAISPEFCNFVRASKEEGARAPREGAGKAGCSLHPRSHVQWATKQYAHEQTGEAEAVRPSLRNGFTAYAVLSLVTGFLATIAPKQR